MGAIASQPISLTIVYLTVCSDADQRKHQSSASLVFVRGIHRGPVNSPHKWPVTAIFFLPFDDVIMPDTLHRRYSHFHKTWFANWWYKNKMRASISSWNKSMSEEISCISITLAQSYNVFHNLIMTSVFVHEQDEWDTQSMCENRLRSYIMAYHHVT